MPTATKNVTLQEDKPSLRVTSGILGGDLRQQSEFADFEASAAWKSRIFMKILHHDRSGETWPRSGFLLARSLDVRLGACESSLHFRNWKNKPSSNELGFSWKINDFHSKKYILLTPYLPLNMPAATKSITLQKDKPYLQVTSWKHNFQRNSSKTNFLEHRITLERSAVKSYTN